MIKSLRMWRCKWKRAMKRKSWTISHVLCWNTILLVLRTPLLVFQMTQLKVKHFIKYFLMRCFLLQNLLQNAYYSFYLTWRCSFLFSVTASFSCTMKFVVKDCDPATGEPDDDEGYDDEYVVRVTCFYKSLVQSCFLYLILRKYESMNCFS